MIGELSLTGGVLLLIFLDFPADGVLEVAEDFVACVIGGRLVKFKEAELILIEIAAIFAENQVVDGGVEVVGDGSEHIAFGELTTFPVACSAGAESQFFEHGGNGRSTFLANGFQSFVKHTKLSLIF